MKFTEKIEWSKATINLVFRSFRILAADSLTRISGAFRQEFSGTEDSKVCLQESPQGLPDEFLSTAFPGQKLR